MQLHNPMNPYHLLCIPFLFNQVDQWHFFTTGVSRPMEVGFQYHNLKIQHRYRLHGPTRLHMLNTQLAQVSSAVVVDYLISFYEIFQKLLAL